MHTYQILETLIGSWEDADGNEGNCPPGKYCCKVSFNGKPAHYYEVESLDPIIIDQVLSEVASADEAQTSSQEEQVAQAELIQFDEAGKIIIPN